MSPSATALARATPDTEKIAEALRIYRRYQVEFVEALCLCPWAERARLDGRVSEQVILHWDDFISNTLSVVDQFAAHSDIEIGLIIYAGLRCERSDFERRVASVIDADRERYSLHSPPFAFAAFHPDAQAVVSHAERLVPFLRRSPDPTIQLVRVSALTRVRQGTSEGTAFFDPRTINVKKPPPKREEPLRERIARANLQTITKLGPDHAEAILQSIFSDRDSAYSRIGLYMPSTTAP